MADRVHKSLRIDAALADRVRASMRDGESESAAYVRLIATGLDAMEHGDDGGGSAPQAAAQAPTEAPEDSALVEALRAHVETLRAQVGTMTGQMAAKDEQIASLTRLADQAQRLQAMGAGADREPKPIEEMAGEVDQRRGGFFARVFGRGGDRQ